MYIIYYTYKYIEIIKSFVYLKINRIFAQTKNMNQVIKFFKEKEIVSMTVTPESVMNLINDPSSPEEKNFWGTVTRRAFVGGYYHNGTYHPKIEDVVESMNSTDNRKCYFVKDGKAYIKPNLCIVTRDGKQYPDSVTYFFDTFEQALEIGEALGGNTGLKCVLDYLP